MESQLYTTVPPRGSFVDAGPFTYDWRTNSASNFASSSSFFLKSQFILQPVIIHFDAYFWNSSPYPILGFPLRRSYFEPKSGHVGFVVVTVALSQVSPSTLVSAANHSTGCPTFIIMYHPGLVQYTVQIVTEVSSGLSFAPGQGS
jgi:hypothetical protein